MKTHPFVLGLLVSLLVDSAVRRGFTDVWGFLYNLILILIPAGLVAVIEWFSRLEPDESDDDIDI